MIRLKIIKAGDSLGAASSGLLEGDTVFPTKTSEGYVLSAPDSGLQEQLRIGREVMKRHRHVLRQLAKS
jgi:hypothetical protein